MVTRREKHVFINILSNYSRLTVILNLYSDSNRNRGWKLDKLFEALHDKS